MINYKKGLRALDVGTGTGKCMTALSKAGFDVYGIEPSKKFYQRAIECMDANVNQLSLASIEEAEFPNDFFDFITLNAVLEHLPNPSDSIAKVIKWVKPDGVIRVEVPSSHWLMAEMAKFYYRMIGTRYVVNLSPMHKPYHLYEFALESFKMNGEINHYSIEDVEYFVCCTYTPSPLDFLLKFCMEYTNSGMEICVWLRKRP